MRKEDSTRMLMIIVGFAIVIGFLIAKSAYQPRSAIDYELQQLALNGARKAQTIGLVFRVSILMLIILTVGGVGVQLLRWLSCRANTIYPNKDGVYPIIRERIGGQRVLHDPNRAPTSVTVYAVDGQGVVNVVHVLAQDFSTDEQLQATTQAQATQAIIAATRQGLTAQSRQLVERVVTRPALSPPLPEVEILDLEPSHVERLLEDQGGP